MNDKYIPRSVRRADYLLIIVELIHNVMAAIHSFTESLLELAIYTAERETKVARAEDELSQSLEKLQEE